MEKLDDKCDGKILVTGSKGFVGSHVLKYLTNKGLDVVGHSREDCDLLDQQQVKKFFDNKDIKVIVHCAANTGFKEEDQKLDTFYNNILMYENLCLVFNGLILNIGSGDEFDHSKEILNVEESFLGNRIPKSFYGFSKYVIAHRIKNEPSQVNLRIFGVFGAGERANRFVTQSVKKIIDKEPITIYNDIFMDFFSVKDFCRVIEFYITTYSKKVPKLFRDVNVCYSKKYKLSDIAELLNGIAEYKVPICSNFYGKDKSLNYTGNGNLLSSLNIPLEGLEEGLRDIFTHICKQSYA